MTIHPHCANLTTLTSMTLAQYLFSSTSNNAGFTLMKILLKFTKLLKKSDRFHKRLIQKDAFINQTKLSEKQCSYHGLLNHTGQALR